MLAVNSYVVVFPYTESAKETFTETWELMKALQTSGKYDIRFEKIDPADKEAVYRIMGKYWGKGADIVWIEHDMMFTEKQLIDLICCTDASPNGCTGPYALWDLPDMTTVGTDEKTRYTFSDIENGGIDYVEFYGMGFTKIRAEIQVGSFELPLWKLKRAPGGYIETDTMVYRYFRNKLGFSPDFHVHSIVEHLHTKERHL